MLDLLLTQKEGLIRGLKVKGILGCSGHEMVEFSIPRAGTTVKSKLTTLHFSPADFGLFKNMLRRVPWDKALEGRGVKETFLIFKDHLIQAQEWSIPTNK